LLVHEDPIWRYFRVGFDESPETRVSRYSIKTTASPSIDFDTAGLPSRSVLYRLEPDFYPHGTGVVIGFFDFKQDGTLTFTAGPPPERTTISKITRSGNIATAWFSTVNLVGYRLRYTDSAGLTTPISSWSIGSTLIGDGTTLFLQDTSSAGNRFYTIEAYY